METDLLDDVKVDLYTLHSRLLRLSTNRWLLEAVDKTKLTTFIKIVDTENPRVIVSSNISRAQRSLLCKLKLEILPLEIEGRWKYDPLETRI